MATSSSALQPDAHDFKVVVLGDKGVGKTCIVLRYIEGIFSHNTRSTIGAFFLTKKLSDINGYNRVNVQIWDTAGQERFRAMAPMYYRGASAAILVFDVTDENSFLVMKDWVAELHANAPEDIVITIAANKSDLVRRSNNSSNNSSSSSSSSSSSNNSNSDANANVATASNADAATTTNNTHNHNSSQGRVVSSERVARFAESIGALLFDTSAMEGTGIEEMFHDITHKVTSLARTAAMVNNKGQNSADKLTLGPGGSGMGGQRTNNEGCCK